MSELTPQQKIELRRATVEAAQERIGVKEDGPPYNNTGKSVDAYLAYVGDPSGSSWCAAFACYCLHLAGAIAPVGTVKPSGYCPTLAENARTANALISAEDAASGTSNVKAGDLMLMWEPDLSGYHHAGIIEVPPLNDGTFYSIEGNTNTNGSREGYEVARQIRNVRDVAGDGHGKYAFVCAV